MRTQSRKDSLAIVRCALALTVGLTLAAGARTVHAHQTSFKSADDAVHALIDAVKAGNKTALLAIFGPEGGTIVSSGDPVADRMARDRFAERAAERTHLTFVGDDFAALSVGNDDWPFAVPLLKGKSGWRFYTAAGKDEILNRRIGRNELNTIHVCQEYVTAQHDYARRMRAADGIIAYAQRVRSSQGQHDGLYWETAEGQDESPLGPLVASAERQGYHRAAHATGPQPYHGYVFRILTAQGGNAPGGEKSYIVDGRMSGGFALIAYPVEHGVSGIMTFVVNQQGVVFQKDLGKHTSAIASAAARYDPDDSWTPVDSLDLGS
jgi:hypothetical protein